MMCYSIQPRKRIFVKNYEFSSFTKNIGANIGKDISKNVSGKHRQKPLHHAKQCATDACKTAKLLQEEQFKSHQKQLVI